MPLQLISIKASRIVVAAIVVACSARFEKGIGRIAIRWYEGGPSDGGIPQFIRCDRLLNNAQSVCGCKPDRTFLVATVNVAPERQLITLDCQTFRVARFEFELAGLPVLATS